MEINGAKNFFAKVLIFDYDKHTLSEVVPVIFEKNFIEYQIRYLFPQIFNKNIFYFYSSSSIPPSGSSSIKDISILSDSYLYLLIVLFSESPPDPDINNFLNSLASNIRDYIKIFFNLEVESPIVETPIGILKSPFIILKEELSTPPLDIFYLVFNHKKIEIGYNTSKEIFIYTITDEEKKEDRILLLKDIASINEKLNLEDIKSVDWNSQEILFVELSSKILKTFKMLKEKEYKDTGNRYYFTSMLKFHPFGLKELNRINYITPFEKRIEYLKFLYENLSPDEEIIDIYTHKDKKIYILSYISGEINIYQGFLTKKNFEILFQQVKVPQKPCCFTYLYSINTFLIGIDKKVYLFIPYKNFLKDITFYFKIHNEKFEAGGEIVAIRSIGEEGKNDLLAIAQENRIVLYNLEKL